MGYATISAGSVALEPLLASNAAWLVVFCLASLWAWWVSNVAVVAPQASLHSLWALGLACGPLWLVWLARAGGLGWDPAYWEPLWLASFSGISFAFIASCRPPQLPAIAGRVWQSARSSRTIAWVAAGLAGAWWFLQATKYYNDFFLGYNDFGHFAQRIANTAAGRGMLLETPVLPMFWDHFNPGLLLLVPLWQMFPSPHLFFGIQAVALAAGSLTLRGLAIRLNYSPMVATLFGLAWLAYPAVGQMNVAYTYGWHPITIAIPLLIGGLWALAARKFGWAVGMVLLAMSMEEGVIAVVSLFCFSCAADCAGLYGRRDTESGPAATLGLALPRWLTAAVISALGFLLVVRFSGLAEFQTGRFVALGNSPSEILLSPFLRPSAFWGQIFRWEKLGFVLSLWLPCYAFGFLRGWRWLLPSLPPLMLLIVWDHKPAASLGFQYSSSLLPIFWLATLIGGRLYPIHTAVGSLTTGLVLSLFVGQLPYSSPTLLDVAGQTYGGAEVTHRRLAHEDDGRWLTAQVAQIQQDGSAVLATGRIAAHCVGNRDVETVSQYLERRDLLAKLADRNGQPLLHYRWIILDRQERFQQAQSATLTVETEAQHAGYQVVAENYDIVVLRRPTDRPRKSP